MSKVKENADIPSGWLGMLIKWNLSTGEYELYADGPSVHYHTLELLLEHVKKNIKSYANEDGMLGKAEKIEDNNTPPWLKGN